MSALKAPRLRVPYQGEIVDVRALIKRRSDEMGYNYQNLSLGIGRAKGWLADFINKGSPRRLNDEDREKLGAMLQLHPDQLRGGIMGWRALPEPVAPLNRTDAPGPIGRVVPLYKEHDPMDPTKATVWVQPFYADGGPAAAAITIAAPVAGRLMPGDICYAKSEMRLESGDLVVLMSEADSRVTTIGVLDKLSAKYAEIRRNRKPEMFPLAGSRLLKIVGTILP